jgi:hypothetical protein
VSQPSPQKRKLARVFTYKEYLMVCRMAAKATLTGVIDSYGLALHMALPLCDRSLPSRLGLLWEPRARRQLELEGFYYLRDGRRYG